MKRCFVFIAVLMLLNMQWLPFTYAQVVNIPDPNLAAKLREALSLNPTDDITQAAIDHLSNLAANKSGITDITGLEAARNLRTLSLSDNPIADVSGISALTGLTWLAITGMDIADISFLSGLTEMEYLYLSGNRIRDVSALAGMTHLKHLYILDNQVTDISVLSSLTELNVLDISLNPIESLLPLEDLVDLETLVIDPQQYSENQDVLARILPAGLTIYLRLHEFTEENILGAIPTTPEDLETDLAAYIEDSDLEKPVQHFRHCGIGWAPDLHRGKRPKVMIYALEFEYVNGQYTCSTIEIRTGDDTLSDLNGWQLYLGTLYNPSYIPIKLTHANSQITDNVLRLTPEVLGQQTFKTVNCEYAGQPLPSVHYVLKTENNRTVDMAYSCFLYGLTAHMQEKGVWQKSPRRITSQALRAMQTPRIERFILDPKQIYITYMRIDDFEWDRGVFSDWLLSTNEEPESAGGNAPAHPYKKLTTYWGTLKRHKD